MLSYKNTLCLKNSPQAGLGPLTLVILPLDCCSGSGLVVGLPAAATSTLERAVPSNSVEKSPFSVDRVWAKDLAQGPLVALAELLTMVLLDLPVSWRKPGL